jgi:hypothetical protein
MKTKIRLYNLFSALLISPFLNQHLALAAGGTITDNGTGTNTGSPITTTNPLSNGVGGLSGTNSYIPLAPTTSAPTLVVQAVEYKHTSTPTTVMEMLLLQSLHLKPKTILIQVQY